MTAYRMVYIPTTGSNPHSLPLLAPSARDATQLAETLCALPGWVLLTVKPDNRRIA